MGDFGYQPSHIRLFDQHLTLDPDIVRMMGEIEAQMTARSIISDMLQPNWRLLLPDFQSIISTSASDVFRTPTPSQPASAWTATPGAGPATPRAGELSDVTGALYNCPPFNDWSGSHTMKACAKCGYSAANGTTPRQATGSQW